MQKFVSEKLGGNLTTCGSAQELEEKVRELEEILQSKSKVRRILVDELRQEHGQGLVLKALDRDGVIVGSAIVKLIAEHGAPLRSPSEL